MTAAADIARALDALARARPAFHSEADFQHALAWSLHELDPGAEVRLERPTPWEGPRGAVDIWLRGTGGAAALELKYWTQAARLDLGGEQFEFRDWAADLQRYEFWKDVARTERLVGDGCASSGYVVALANIKGCWGRPRRGWERTNDAAFRLHKGRNVEGTLDWAAKTAASTRKGRPPLALRGRYVTSWREYSRPAPGCPGGEFRCLLLDIGEGLRGKAAG